MRDDARIDMALAVGIIGFIIFASLVIAAFTPVFGSVHADAVAAGTPNSTHNMTYNTGVSVAQGFVGFDMGIVFIMLIVLVVVVILLMFAL